METIQIWNTSSSGICKTTYHLVIHCYLGRHNDKVLKFPLNNFAALLLSDTP